VIFKEVGSLGAYRCRLFYPFSKSQDMCSPQFTSRGTDEETTEDLCCSLCKFGYFGWTGACPV
jgi:hypothetical protein